MKTTFIAVRHGETEWNKIALQQGHLNSDLTELGKLQAKAIADGLKSYKIDHFYSSDLGRATQTADIISEIIGLKYTVEERLRERNLGILQGMTKNDFKIKFPDEYDKLNSNEPEWKIPDGESIKDRYIRSIEIVEDLAKKHYGKTILLVTHGGILMSFIHKALNIPLNQKRRYSLFNGSINIFSISESMEWGLDVWGDINHMRLNNLSTLDDN